MRIFVFKKVGFKDRQSEKLKDANNRKAILIDVNINNDMKVLCLHQQKDYTLLPTYLEIIFNLDLETESWEVREDSLVSWCKRTFGVNNRFNVLQRLEFLQSQGLISFEVIGNNYKTMEEVSVNNDQSYKEVIPNLSETITEVTPLETPETLVALRAFKTNKANKDKQTYIDDFQEFYKKYPNKVAPRNAEKAYLSARSKHNATHEEILEGLDRYIATKPKWKNWQNPSTWLNGQCWMDEPATNEIFAVGTSQKPTCPAVGDPDYDKKMATYLASIPVGFAEYKNRGN